MNIINTVTISDSTSFIEFMNTLSFFKIIRRFIKITLIKVSKYEVFYFNIVKHFF